MPPTANTPASDPEAKKRAARETIDILHEISTLLVRQIPISSQTNKPQPRKKSNTDNNPPEHRSRPAIAQLLRVSDREWRQP
jgi:hypothetical protein